MYDYGARFYDPSISLWTTVDPLTGEMPDHGAYNYTFQNPIMYNDPTGMKGEGVDDHIIVCSDGVVSDVIEMEGPNRFFDEATGDELFFNDPKNHPEDKRQVNEAKFEVGDQLYKNMKSQDLWDMLVEAGFDAKKDYENGNYIDRYTGTKKRSGGDSKADFPAQLSKYGYAEEDWKTTPKGDGVEAVGTPIRFKDSNMLYNPSDAGQFIWGGWMRANRFTLLQARAGAHYNEFGKRGRFGDSVGDQRAIKAGFNWMSKW